MFCEKLSLAMIATTRKFSINVYYYILYIQFHVCIYLQCSGVFGKGTYSLSFDPLVGKASDTLTTVNTKTIIAIRDAIVECTIASDSAQVRHLSSANEIVV